MRTTPPGTGAPRIKRGAELPPARDLAADAIVSARLENALSEAARRLGT